MIEVELLPDSYLLHRDAPLDAAARATYVALWRDALAAILDAPPTWVLRDFHSPNLMWLPDRTGIARVGLLDFQDAVMGPPAYDVASLLQDARVDVSEEMEVELSRARGRWRVATPTLLYSTPRAGLLDAAAQRASKILGNWPASRPPRRQAPSISANSPRVVGYLRAALARPCRTQWRWKPPVPAERAAASLGRVRGAAK